MEQTYHHGDLKHALIAAGLKLLAESGIEGLSLRKMAREVGVSHNAPYMHFADKEAVLAAIAEQGFELLGTALEEGQQVVMSHALEGRLLAAARSYVTFALGHPNHLLVMFGALAASDYPDLMRTSHATFEKLVRIMAAETSGGPTGLAAEQQALLFWITIHGLSALLIAQKMPEYARQGLTDDQLTEQCVQMIYRGVVGK